MIDFSNPRFVKTSTRIFRFFNSEAPLLGKHCNIYYDRTDGVFIAYQFPTNSLILQMESLPEVGDQGFQYQDCGKLVDLKCIVYEV